MDTTALLTPERFWVVRQMLFGEVLRELDGVLWRLGVEYMPIKGAYLICAGLAPRLRRRRMADVDLLVRPGDFAAAVGWLERSPQARARPGVWPFERTFLYRCAGHWCLLEVHRALNYDERFRLPAEELFRRGVRGEGVRVLPSAEDALLVAIAHALVHVVEGFDGAHFDEYRLLMGRPGFDWTRFWQLAEGSGIAPFVELVLRYLKRAQDTGAVLPPHGALRARLLAALAPIELYGRMPRWLRRAVLEAWFVRDPLGLALRRLCRLLRDG